MEGLTGPDGKPPSQFGRTLLRHSSTQLEQGERSKVQVTADVASGGNLVPQFTQIGLSSDKLSISLRALKVPVREPAG